MQVSGQGGFKVLGKGQLVRVERTLQNDKQHGKADQSELERLKQVERELARRCKEE